MYASIDHGLVLEELGSIINDLLLYVDKIVGCMKERGIDP